MKKTNFLKAKTKDCALSSFKLYNEKDAVSSLNREEIFALKTLPKNKDLIIQKSDKGNSLVLINKSDYLDKMYNILSGSKIFVKSSVMDDKHLNFIDGIDKKLNDLSKESKASGAISETGYKKLKPKGSSFVVLYGLCKTNKKVLDKCPPFKSTLSAIKNPSYNLANCYFPLLNQSQNIILQLKTVLNSLRKYVNTILNTL